MAPKVEPAVYAALPKSADLEQAKKAAAAATADPEAAKKAAQAVLENGRESANKRAQEFIMSLHNNGPDSPAKQALACFLKYLVKPLIIIAMIYIWIFQQLYKVYKILPLNVVHMVFGVALCFFGGTYFAAIAAVEAFRQFGGELLWDELKVVYEQGSLVAEAHAIDETLDKDENGIADVQEMSTNELISHKAKVAMVAIKEPERLMNSLQFLLSTWIAVIATLKVQFARTVAVALGIASMLELPFVRILGPPLAMVMGPDLQHWPATIIIVTIKIIAVCIATYLQSIISAFYSGLRGARLFAEGLLFFLGSQGLMDKFPDSLVEKPFNPENSYLDEAIGFPLAAFGFYYQITHGFSLPFPWNLLLLPLTIVEWIIRFQVFTA